MPFPEHAEQVKHMQRAEERERERERERESTVSSRLVPDHCPATDNSVSDVIGYEFSIL